MLCALEIGMLIFGIVTLAKGEMKLGRERVVRGLPAYLIGGILTGTLPAALVLGFAIGIWLVASGHAQPDELNIKENPWLILIDIGAIAGSGIVCLSIGLIFAKDPSELAQPLPPYGNYPPGFPPNLGKPMDPTNPYAPPPSHDSHTP